MRHIYECVACGEPVEVGTGRPINSLEDLLEKSCQRLDFDADGGYTMRYWHGLCNEEMAEYLRRKYANDPRFPARVAT